MSLYSKLTPFSIAMWCHFKWQSLEKFFYRHAKTCERNRLVLSASMPTQVEEKARSIENPSISA